VRVEEIETLDVQIYAMATARSGASRPSGIRRRGTADHSLPYMLAVALVDGRITPASFEPKRYLDPSLRPIMNRSVSPRTGAHAALPRRVTLADRRDHPFGPALTERAEYPKGHARNPMTDGDVETKFRDLAEGVLGKSSGGRGARDASGAWTKVSRMGAVVDLFIPQR